MVRDSVSREELTGLITSQVNFINFFVLSAVF